MEKFLSYAAGILLAVLIVFPPVAYTIPLMHDPVLWSCLTLVAAMLGMYAIRIPAVPIQVKILSVYLFVTAFLSQGPHSSFNAYVVFVGSVYLFLWFRGISHWQVVLDFIEAAFWVQVVLATFQLAGWDRLISFNKLRESHFLGTVTQYMRFSSVLAIMTPFLIIRNWKYIFLIAALAIVSQSSSFAISLLAGCGTYFWVTRGRWSEKAAIVLLAVTAGTCYVLYDWGSFMGAVDPANGGRLSSWEVVIRTWVFDTIKVIPGQELIGPVMWKWIFLGHGLDTFMYLFPVYKHDPNPFGQAHNFYLQQLWECGLIGLGLVLWWIFSLAIRLYRSRLYIRFSGLVMICTNMFFTFPERMTQTALLLVLYVALCEQDL